MVMRYENRSVIYCYKPEGFAEMGISKYYVLIMVAQ